MEKETIKSKMKKILLFLLNPRLLFCIGIGWLITNGWSYVVMGIGVYYGIEWMIAVSGAWLAFLWLPFTPEKIATVAIAIALLRWLFPKDEKTLAVLRDMSKRAREAIRRRKDHRKEKHAEEQKTKDEDSEES